ncbi:MAG: FecCD family ABC transporter permease [Thermoleophilia bacterium]
MSGRAVRLWGGRVSRRPARRPAVVCGLLVLVIVGVGALALGTGEVSVAPGDILRTLVGAGSPEAELIVGTLRLPRAVNALMVGGALGVAGAIFQSITRNPLGSPDIVGVTWGSATGALFQIMVAGGGSAAVAGGAVGGGLATAVAVYALGRGGAGPQRLLLVGIGVSSLLAALNTYLIARAPLDTAEAARVWLTGSLNGRGWEYAGPLALSLCVLMPLAAIQGPRLRTLETGDDLAAALGVPIERTRLALISTAVLLTAVATATAGPVSFVALAAPQIARRLTRRGVPELLPSALMGGVLLLAGDLIAQRALPGGELPVGIATGALGGLYLIWLLFTEWGPRAR